MTVFGLRRSVAVRSASVADLDAIAAIEAAAFDAPWTREIFAAELDRSIARLVIAEASVPWTGTTEIVGFACTWHVVDEAHLLRIAVEPARRRHGIASTLVRRVLADAAAAGCVQVDLEVGRSNAAAVALYASAGFREVGVRRGYYQHPPDDAVLLRASVAPAKPGPPIADDLG